MCWTGRRDARHIVARRPIFRPCNSKVNLEKYDLPGIGQFCTYNFQTKTLIKLRVNIWNGCKTTWPVKKPFLMHLLSRISPSVFSSCVILFILFRCCWRWIVAGTWPQFFLWTTELVKVFANKFAHKSWLRAVSGGNYFKECVSSSFTNNPIFPPI